MQSVNGFIKRNSAKLTDPGHYGSLLALMEKEKETVLLEVDKELGKEVPLKEHVLVVLT